PLTRPDGVPVELHWTITRPTAPFKIDLDGLWERARPALIGGVEALVLSVEDLLLHLCLHAAFDHQFFLGFRACWDIRQTIQHHDSEIDWEQLQDRARQWGVSKYVYLTLHLAKDLLGAAVPPHAITALRPDGFDPRLMAWAKAELLTDRSAAVPVPPTLAQMRGDMRAPSGSSPLADRGPPLRSDRRTRAGWKAYSPCRRPPPYVRPAPAGGVQTAGPTPPRRRRREPRGSRASRRLRDRPCRKRR